MKFSSYLDPAFIYTGVEAETKDELIGKVLDQVALKERSVGRMKEDIFKSIMNRENEISTCMGMGMAIPHARIDNFHDFVISIATVKKPIKCQVAALNQEDDVEVFFIIASEVLKNKRMLKLMAGIMKMATKTPHILEEIKKCKDPNKIYQLIKDVDIEIDGKIIAEDVLSPDLHPAVVTDTLEEISKRLIVEGRTGLPVVTEDGSFLGEITERELIEFGMPKYTSVMQDLSFLTVGEPFEEYLLNEKTATIRDLYRTEGVLVVDRNESIMEICFLMVNKGKTRLYVVENGRYLGIIQRSDIIKKILHI